MSHIIAPTYGSFIYGTKHAPWSWKYTRKICTHTHLHFALTRRSRPFTIGRNFRGKRPGPFRSLVSKSTAEINVARMWSASCVHPSKPKHNAAPRALSGVWLRPYPHKHIICDRVHRIKVSEWVCARRTNALCGWQVWKRLASVPKPERPHHLYGIEAWVDAARRGDGKTGQTEIMCQPGRHDRLLLLLLLRGATSANTILCDPQPSSWVTSWWCVVVVVVCDMEHT